jgi:hypothetical protein
MARGIPLVLMLSAGVLADTTALAAEPPSVRCEKTQNRDLSSAAYARRGAYCDGSVQENHSGEGTLPVIGVSATPFTGGVPLSIGVLLGSAAPGELLQLQGVAKSPDVNYRFDAGLNRQLTIGRDSALSKLSLLAKDVAWVAWRPTPEGPLYLPVVAVGATPGALEIIVRPTFAAGYVVYSIHTPGPPKNEIQKQIDLPGTKAPGDPVTFTIPPGPLGLIVVEVTAVAEDGETQAASIRVMRPPVVAQ